MNISLNDALTFGAALLGGAAIFGLLAGLIRHLTVWAMSRIEGSQIPNTVEEMFSEE